MDGRNNVLQVMWFSTPGWSTSLWRLGRVIIAMLVARIVSNARALYSIHPRRTFHRCVGDGASREASKARRPGVAGANSAPDNVKSAGWWTATLATSSRLSRL